MPKSKDLCRGCYNDFYNHRQNFTQYGCWSYDDAKVVKRHFVHLDDVPPWHAPSETTLNCHRRQRFVAIEPKHSQLAKKGRRS